MNLSFAIKRRCGDITTRANVQLRGLTLAEADQIFAGLQRVGLSSVQTGACHWHRIETILRCAEASSRPVAIW